MLAAAATNALRVANWQRAQVYGASRSEPPVPFLPPWERIDADTPHRDTADTGPDRGPIDENTPAGTRRFGNARMTLAEVDRFMGWTAPDDERT